LTRGRIALLAATLFVTYGYFFQAGGWNQDSRFNLVRAILERGTLKITAYHGNTGDKSRVGDEYYSDKAPGHAFLAVPFVAVARTSMKVVGVDPTSETALMWLMYLAALVTAGLPAALTSIAFIWVSRKIGASDGAALFGAVVLCAGTPLFVYATIFWVHSLAASLLFGAFAATLALREAGSPRRDLLLGLGVGFGGGWATISEYPAAVTAALLSLLALAFVYRSGPRRCLRVGGGIAIGAVVCASVLMAYNYAIFGKPLTIAYQHQVNFAPVDQLFKLPSGNNLGLSLFGEYRGLLLLSPLLVAAPVGVGMLLVEMRHRLVALLCWILPAYYFLLNASYEGWYGGWCYGPRNVASALAFLVLPLTILWTRTGWWMRVPLLLAGIYGIGLAVMAAAVTGQPHARVSSPINQLWWLSFKEGNFSLFPGAWNWGQRLGLEGRMSLLPLFLLWALAAAGWVLLGQRRARVARRRAAPAVSPPEPNATGGSDGGVV
jgi:hypothetical protein